MSIPTLRRTVSQALIDEGFNALVARIHNRAEVQKHLSDHTPVLPKITNSVTYTGFVQIIGIGYFEPEDDAGYIETKHVTGFFTYPSTIDECKQSFSLEDVRHFWRSAISQTILEDDRIEQVRLLDNLGNTVALADVTYDLSGSHLIWVDPTAIDLIALLSVESKEHDNATRAFRSDSFHSLQMAEDSLDRVRLLRAISEHASRVADQRLCIH